jgi:hypothetical protein
MEFNLELVWNCSHGDDTIEGGLMMWVSSIMDGNRQKKKRLAIECKALKWANANSAPPKGSPLWVPMVEGMIMTSPSQLWWLLSKGDSNA